MGLVLLLGAPLAGYEKEVKRDAPISYWRLGEAAGTVAADEVGANAGTYVGSPTLGVTGAVGDADTAITTAAGKYISVVDANSLDWGNGPFSVEFWFKRGNAAGDFQIIYGKGTQGNVYISSSKLALDNNDAVNIVESSGTITDTTWHHGVITRSGTGTGNNKVYIDGVDVTVDGAGINNTVVSNATAPRIGIYTDSISEPFIGSLDEVAVYNTVLSAARVLAHYNARAIARVAERASYGSSALSTAHVVALTNPTAITVGNHLIMRIITSGTALFHTSSITDPRGNTWTQDAGPLFVLSGYGTSIWSCKVATAYQAGDSLTLNSNTSAHLAAVADEFSGLAVTGWADNAATLADEDATQNPNTFTTGFTATTAQANELLIGALGSQGSANVYVVTPETLSPAWAALGSVGSTGTVRTIFGHYRIVAAAATYKYAGTLDLLGTESTLIATYKSASGGGGGGGGGAIAHVAERANFGSAALGTAHTVTLTNPTAIAVGNHLILRMVATATTTATITDPRGNTWTDVGPNPVAGANHNIRVFSSKVEFAYLAGDALTVNLGTSRFMACVVDEFSGLASTSWLDKTASASDGTGTDTAYDTGLTAATVQADELLLGALGTSVNPAPITPEVVSPVWTALGVAASTTTVRRISGHYRIVAATGTYKYAGTLNVAGVDTEIIATFKAAAAGGTTFNQAVEGSITPTGAVVRIVIKQLRGTVTPAGAITRGASRNLSGGVTPTGVTIRTPSRSLAGSITPSGSALSTLVKALAGGLTPAGALFRSAKRYLAGALTPAASLRRSVSRYLVGALTPAGVTVRIAVKQLLGTVTSSGTILRTAVKRLAGSITPTGALAARTVVRTLAGSITPVGVLVRAVSRYLTGSLTPAGTVARSLSRLLTGAITPAGTVRLTASRVLTGALSPAGSLARTAYRSLTGTVSPSGLTLRNPSKKLAGAITPAATMKPSLTKLFTGSLTPAGSLARPLVRKHLVGSLTSAGALLRALARVLTGNINPNGTVAKQSSRLLTGSLTPSAIVRRAPTRYVTGGLTPSGSITRSAIKRVSGSVTPTGALFRLTSRSLAGSLTPTGSVSRSLTVFRTGALTPAGSVSKRAAKTQAGTVTTAGQVIRQATLRLAGTITPAGGVFRTTGKRLDGTLTPTGAVLRTSQHLLNGTVTPSGSLIRAVVRLLAGTLTPAGSLRRDLRVLLAGSIVGSGTLTRTPRIGVTGQTPTAGDVALLVRMVLSGATTPTGSPSRAVSRLLVGNLTPTGLSTELVRKLVDGSITPTGALITSQASQTIYLEGTIGPTGLLVRDALLHEAGSTTGAGSVDRKVEIDLVGNLTSGGQLVRVPRTTLGGSMTPAGSLSTSAARTRLLAGGIAGSGVLVRQFSQHLSGLLVPSAVVRLTAVHRLTGLIVPTGVARHTGRLNLGGTINPLGTLTTETVTGVLLLGGTIGSSATVNRAANRHLASSLTPVGSVRRAISRSIAGTVAPTGSVLSKLSLTLTGAVGAASGISWIVRRHLNGSLTPVGTLVLTATVLPPLYARVTVGSAGRRSLVNATGGGPGVSATGRRYRSLRPFVRNPPEIGADE